MEERIFNVIPSPEAVRLAERYGYLPYMVERYFEIMGDEVRDFLEACEKPLKRSIRCNTLKIRCRELEDRLALKGFKLERIPWAMHGFWVEGGEVSLGATLEYLLGYYYIQGAASMIPAYMLAPRRGEAVADLAAAPGGKTTQMAQLMGNTGIILAVDVSRRRIKALRSNINRMGVTNTIILRTDARRLVALGEVFDAVLLDAPCTGEGLIPLDPSRKTSRTPEDLQRLSRLQMELLETAVRILLPGGRLVYSTCTIGPEENEYVVSQVLDKHPELEVLDTGLEIGRPGLREYRGVFFDYRVSRCKRMYPHIHGTEGFFVCLLGKS